mgnify:CR=1 FL=1
MTAKEAAARVLASKLGTDAGLKLSSEQSQDDEMATNTNASSVGIRRRAPQPNSSSLRMGEPAPSSQPHEGRTSPPQYRNGPSHPRMEAELKPSSGGWVAKLAAVLVGEDPTQSYALICGNCKMHNGEYFLALNIF